MGLIDGTNKMTMEWEQSKLIDEEDEFGTLDELIICQNILVLEKNLIWQATQ